MNTLNINSNPNPNPLNPHLQIDIRANDSNDPKNPNDKQHPVEIRGQSISEYLANNQKGSLFSAQRLKEKIRKSEKPTWKKITLSAVGLCCLGLGAASLIDFISTSSRAREAQVRAAAMYARSKAEGFTGCTEFYTQSFLQFPDLDRSLCYNKEAGLALERYIVNYIQSFVYQDKFRDRLSPELTNDKEFMSRLVAADIVALKLLGSDLKNNPQELFDVLKAAQKDPWYAQRSEYKDVYGSLVSINEDKDLCLKILSTLVPTEKNSFLNSYDSVDSLDFFYQALSPGLKNNAEVISALIHRAYDYRFLAYQFIRKIIENVKDTEEVASVLYLKDPKQFCSQYYEFFSEEVQKSEALQNTVWNHFLPKWNEAVQSTNSKLHRIKRNVVNWTIGDQRRYSELFLLMENLSLSKQAILTIIKSYPGDLNDLINKSWLRGVIKDREIALALIDAYKVSPYHQTCSFCSQIYENLARNCDDEEVAELLYKQKPTLFHSFSTRLRRDQAFSRKIGRSTSQSNFHNFDWSQYFGHEQQQNNNIIPASVDLGDSKIKQLLKMDVWTRASSKEINNNIKQHAQLILFDQVAKTEREAESMLKKFKEFQNAGCKKFNKNYRKLNKKGHPDKIRQLKDAQMAALIEQGIRNINSAYITCCKGAQEVRANHNPIPK